jgi:sphingolipid 4-desaturase/C4-monooxygenase
VSGLDADLPTALEALCFESVLGKAFFCTFQILFYAIRPMFVYMPRFTPVHLLNIIVQLAFDYALIRFCGGSYQPLFYLIWSSFLAGSLHPCAGHFVAEHYFFSRSTSLSTESLKELKDGKTSSTSSDQVVDASILPPETYSYYGPLNILTYNVGFHNEHHDFPAIPWTRLPKLHRIAAEFYEPLPCHQSWSWAMWTFIFDRNVGMWCRVKRAEGGRIVGGSQNSSNRKNNATFKKRGTGRGGEGISAASIKPEDDADEGNGWKESEIQN